jgi:hypothetical protein
MKREFWRSHAQVCRVLLLHEEHFCRQTIPPVNKNRSAHREWQFVGHKNLGMNSANPSRQTTSLPTFVTSVVRQITEIHISEQCLQFSNVTELFLGDGEIVALFTVQMHVRIHVRKVISIEENA